MSSNLMEIIPDLNLPDGICQTNTQQIEFTAPISGDGTCDLNLPDGICQTNTHQMELSDEDVSIESMAPISGDGTSDINSPDGIRQTNTHQMELSDEDAPISGDVDHANVVVDVAGAIVPADTENLLFEKHRHQVEVPAQDARIGFTAAPITRDAHHANGVADVAVAIVPANTEKLLFKKHRHLWAVAGSSEACRKMPQDPHFLPLKSCKEIVREGQALGKIVTFENIAKNISNLRPDTKREAIKDDFLLLEELETNGFDVALLKNRLNRTLSLKNQQEKLENMLEQRKRQLMEHDLDKCKNKEKIAKIEERMKELQKETELAAKMDKDRDAKIAAEQLAERVRGEELHRIKIQFKELVASLLH